MPADFRDLRGNPRAFLKRAAFRSAFTRETREQSEDEFFMTKIILDGMGGDNAPEEIVKGAVCAVNADKELSVVITGDEGKISPVLAGLSYEKERISLVHCTEVITNDDVPTLAIRQKKDSSLVVALKMLKEDESAKGFVSAGSTGAVLTGALLRVGRIRGVSRPAVCPVLPTAKEGKVLIIDAGANAECKPVNLAHFAIMGTAYAKANLGIANPRVGLVTNGTEEHKGDPLHQEAHELLKKLPGICFVGNVEGRDIMSGDIDVAVCDGFSGNIALKTTEGTAMAVMKIIKKNISESFWAKVGYALFMRKAFKKIKRVMDYNKYGGAVLLGIEKVVVKSHGSSKADSICASLLQAKEAAEHNVTENIKALLSEADLENLGASES